VPPQRQTNIRLDEPVIEWLETTAYIHRRSVADELRAAVDDWLDRHRDDPRVRAARELRDAVPDKASVSSLEAKRQQAGEGEA
jgi:hypothetical protein